MKLIERESCVVSQENDLENIYTFKNFPVYMGCSDNTKVESDIKEDMRWMISRSSGLIQLGVFDTFRYTLS